MADNGDTTAGNSNHIPLVFMENITRRFGLIAALENVDFALNSEDRRAAGRQRRNKSTLIKVLTGVTLPPAGNLLQGQLVDISSPRWRARCRNCLPGPCPGQQ